MIGLKYGRLTITGGAPSKVFPSGRKSQVTATCDCGKDGIYVLSHLKNGNTKSCGCYNMDRITSHGMHDTRQYQTWADMKTRCDNEKHACYSDYGGRGISYDKRWSKFEMFWEDMKGGYSDDLTLDRIDNNGDYTKENCRWADQNTQSHNTRRNGTSKSGYTGVLALDNGKAFAKIKMKTKQVHLGTYKNVEKAAKAYDDASSILYGDRPNGTGAEKDDILLKVKDRIDGAAKGKSFKPAGSDFSSAILNEDQAREIYILAHSGEFQHKEIAAQYGINLSVVSSIKCGRSWKDATQELREEKKEC